MAAAAGAALGLHRHARRRAALLGDVGQLVGHHRVGAVAGAGAEDDVAAVGEGGRAELAVGLGGLGALVDPDVAEVAAQRLLGLEPDAAVERAGLGALADEAEVVRVGHVRRGAAGRHVPAARRSRQRRDAAGLRRRADGQHVVVVARRTARARPFVAHRDDREHSAIAQALQHRIEVGHVPAEPERHAHDLHAAPERPAQAREDAIRDLATFDHRRDRECRARCDADVATVDLHGERAVGSEGRGHRCRTIS